jgi:putative DNA primase/helicase
MTISLEEIIADNANTDTNGAPRITEEDLAMQFAEAHAANLRYVAVWNQWFIWDNVRWAEDETRMTFSLARDLCRDQSLMAKGGDRVRIGSSKTRAALVSLASDDRRMAATVDQWDADIWALNTPTGVIDLRTGTRRDHRPEDYMTKVTTVAPDASCPTPLWSKFLATVTNDNGDLASYLARVSGYSLTGSVQEHALFFNYGLGGNGKGVFGNAISGIMGDYHRTAPIETFTASKSDRHPTELAMLRGARLVTATETEEGRRWAESRIKMLTGDDKISARFMHQNFFDFVPQFKLMISGNHKPGLNSVDEAIRRRFNLVPFTVTIPKDKRDVELSAKLKTEWPGILAWMIAGCVQWQKIALAPPLAVAQATEEYLAAEDTIKQWIDECCRKDPREWTSFGALFGSWQYWAKEMGEYVGTSKRFSQKLVDQGFEPKRMTQRGFSGLTIYLSTKDRGSDGKPLPPEPIWTRPM